MFDQGVDWKKKWPLVFVVVNYLAVLVTWNAFPFTQMLNNHDASMFMYFGRGMNHGLTPYVDMFDHKGIVLFWIEQLANKLSFGRVNLGVLIVEAVFYAVTLFFLWRLLMFVSHRELLSGLTILVLTPVTVISMQGGNLTEELVLPFITCALYYFVRLFWQAKVGNVALFLIGLTGGLTFFVRPNMIAVWVVGCIALLIMDLAHHDYRALVQQVCFIFLGGALVCVAVLAYGLATDSLKPMLFETFKLNIEYSRQTTAGQTQATLSFFNQENFDFGTYLYLTIFLLSWWGHREHNAFNWFIVAYFIVNLMTVFTSGRPYPHYYTTVVPVIALVLIMGLTQAIPVMATWSSSKTVTVIASLGALSLVCGAFPTDSFTHTWTVYQKALYDRPFSEKTASPRVHIAQYIKAHSTPKDKIYVHNVDASIYLYSDRYSNSKFFVLPSLNYAQHPDLVSEFKHDFNAHEPKFVVVNAALMDNVHAKLINGFVRDQVTQHYELIGLYNRGQLLLYQLRH